MKFSTVFESYEERVARVADGISRHVSGSSKKITPDRVRDLAHLHSSHELEGRLGGKAHDHLMKDAIKLARPAISSVNRSLGARARGQSLKGFHNALATEIQYSIGDSIPDGDPFDRLHSSAKRLADRHGVHDYDEYDLGDHLNKAAKINGYKSYHDQLAQAWDDYGSDHAPAEHVLSYHKDDPDGIASHTEHSSLAKKMGKVIRHTTGKDGTVNVYRSDPFENPWK